MKKLMILAVAMVAMAMTREANATYIQIDTFLDGSIASVGIPVGGLGAQYTNSQSGLTSPIGGTRTIAADSSVTTGGATGRIALNDDVSGDAPTPSLFFQGNGASQFVTTVTYDAGGMGLGGINLLTDGAQGIILHVLTADQGIKFTIRVTDSTGVSADSVVKPLGVMSPENLFFSFASFQPQFGPLQFTSVSKIELIAEADAGQIALDWAISRLETGVVPEPTSLALAGFAGIGMAVGAIRRRRQAKQAA